MNEELKGKITLTYKIDFDEENDIKEGNSLKSTTHFDSTVELHTKAEQLNIKLIHTLKEKFPSRIRQTKLTGEESE